MLRWIATSLLAGLPAVLSALLALSVPHLPREVVITLDQSPRDVQVGVPFKVGFTIEGLPAAAPGAPPPVVVASHPASRERVAVAAQPDTAPGHYVALLILPSPGRWNWEIYPEGENQGEPVPMTPLQVADTTPGPLFSAVTAFWLVIVVIAVALLAILVWALWEGRGWPAAAPDIVVTPRE